MTDPVSPAAANDSEFTLSRRVQFYETDAAGIVHFSWYFRYMEEAEHALWRSVGLSIAPAGDSYGWPRVAVSSEYHQPLRFEDEIAIRIRIVGMSGKSLKYACTISRGGVEAASLAMTIVCTKREADGTFRAAPLPEAVRSRFTVAQDA
jgi:acyl-CoA thioester hydrolase